MAEVVASKLKLLHLARIFERETDDDHGLTAPQIIGKLAGAHGWRLDVA